MRRGMVGGAAVLLLVAMVVGPGPGAARAVSPNAAGAVTLSYAATLLTPQGGSKVAGAVAVMGSTNNSGSTASGGNGKSTRTSKTAGAGNMAVAVIVSGLKPGAKADVRLVQGGCTSASARKAAYQLPQVLALPSGDAMVITTITTTQTFVRGYATEVTTPGGAQVLACGVLHKPGMVISLKPDMGGRASGTALLTAPVDVMGSKMLKGTEVIVYATGLQPGLVHPNHIHAGPCGVPSHIMYPLVDLVADSGGRAIEGTAVTDVVPMTGLSLHIHTNTMKPDACGNLGSSGGTGM